MFVSQVGTPKQKLWLLPFTPAKAFAFEVHLQCFLLQWQPSSKVNCFSVKVFAVVLRAVSYKGMCRLHNLLAELTAGF